MACSDCLAGPVALVAAVGCTFFPDFFAALAIGLPRAAANPAFWWVTAAAFGLIAVALALAPDKEGPGASGVLAVVFVPLMAAALVETIPFAAYSLSLGVEFANAASVGMALGTMLFFLFAIWRADVRYWLVAGVVFGYIYLSAAFVQSAAVPPLALYTVPFWTLMLLMLMALARAKRNQKMSNTND